MISPGWTKICGVTQPEDLEMVIAAGADAVGLNLWPGSPRCISYESAKELVGLARGRIATVGVCVNLPESQLLALRSDVGLDWVQLHGDEPAHLVSRLGDRAFKALGIAGGADVTSALSMPGSLVLVDARDDIARGGTGQLAPTSLARRIAAERATVLAGGLGPHNVAERIAAIRPMGVDTASGVEISPGIKDPAKVQAFCLRAREAFSKIEDGVKDV